MSGRHLGAVGQMLARIWLTGAAFSFVLPPAARLGLWLPLHLALAGAVSVAISAAMQTFAGALTAAPDPSRRVALAQLGLVNAGAALVAAGHPAGLGWMLLAGGVAFFAGMVLLAFVVARMWRRSVNRRHPVPMLAYAGALAAILAGSTLGALVGSRAVGGEAWFALRQAHVVVNVLGWATLTIAGTILTLVPTLLRIRIPSWRPLPVIGALSIGAGTLAAGLALGAGPAASGGAVILAIGAAGLGRLAAVALRAPRRRFVPTAAKHLVAGIVWLVAGSVALAATLLTSDHPSPAVALAELRNPFLVAFVAGWILQVLLGAWLYLLPAHRPATPAERRLLLAGVELGGTAQVGLLNAGLLLLAFAGSSRTAGVAGGTLAATGAAAALAKAWIYAPLARTAAARRKAERLWRRAAERAA